MKRIVLLITVIFLFKNNFISAQLTPVCFNSLLSSTTLSVGNSPHSVVNGDFNNDGKIDLVVANYNSNNFSLLLGTNSGTFNTAINFNLVTQPQCVISKDFNNDTKLDLAFAGSSGLTTFFGTGTGSFVIGSIYGGGMDAQSLITADVNNDGSLDIVTANKISNNVSVFLGSITGTFSAATNFSVGIDPYSVISNDFNGDTFIDLAIANSGSNNFSILFGNGNGTFNSPINYNTRVNPRSIISSDFSGDGILDLAISNFGSDSASIFLGNGFGTFSFIANYELGGQPYSIIANDFNADGYIDIASVGLDGFLSILKGLGNGNFVLSGKYSSGNLCTSLSSSDYNNDNKTDIVVTNNNDNTISILLGDGLCGFASTVNYSSGIVSSNIVNDFNNDGFNDIAALSALNKLSILYGGLGGIISSSLTYSLAYLPLDIDSADFNNDGNIDLVIISSGSGSNPNMVSLFFGLNNGTFASPINVYGSYYSNYNDITTSDFNNDGNKDLAIIENNNLSINLFLGAGNGTFQFNSNVANGTNPSSITSGDIDNDGLMDIITTKEGVNLITINRCVAISLGIPTYSAPVNYTVGGIPTDLILKDFNLDGLLDIVTINSTANNVSILLGTGSGLFSSAVNIAIGGYPTSIASKDLNNDGFLDLVIGASVQNLNLIVLLGNGTGSFIIGGKFGSSLYSPSAISLADMNNDGKPDIISEMSGRIGININGSTSILLTGPNNLCLGNNAIITANGATSYTWNNGVTTNSIIVTPTITTTYSVTSTIQIASCSNMASKTINVNALPNLNIISPNSICLNSSLSMSVSGASSYTWNTGATTPSINITPTTTTYSVVGTNSAGCSNTQTVTVTVDNTCQDVWPGDANSDGVADNLDVLELGLHYTQTGVPRASISNTWQSYYAPNWLGTITNGKNLNHSNCNGDGVIDDNDTLAIFNNYNLTHAFKPDQITINPVVTIVPDQSIVNKGTWGTSSIYLGDATTTVSNINGVAFTVNYDSTLLQTDSVWIEYPTSFINASNQNLKFRKRDFSNGKLHTAITHTISGNVSGYGKIAILHYKIKPTLTTDNVLNLSIAQANQSNASGVISSLTTGSATLVAIGASVGLNTLTNDNYFSIHPNPTNGALHINSTTELQKIEVMAVTGQVLLSEVPVNMHHVLNLDNLANGVYIVNLYQNNHIVKREKVVLNK